MQRGLLWLLAGLTVALVAGGCGSGGGEIEPETAPYLPLAINNVWQYTYTDYTATVGVSTARVHPLGARSRGLLLRPASVGTAQTTAQDIVWINGTESIGGQDWFVAIAQYVGSVTQQTTYVRHNAQGLIRRADASDPGYYLLRPPLTVGNTWTDPLDARYRLTITGTNQTISVPDGVFNGCVVVDDVYTETGYPVDTITSWYAYGVGMVKQEHHVGNDLTKTLDLIGHTLVD